MAALITDPILPQRFEIVRDRIAEILAVELQNQIAMQYLTEFDDLKVYLERHVNIDHSELPIVNVTLATSDFDNMKPLDLNGNYFYNVDCYCKAEADEDSDIGDDTAAFRLHRLLGLCRAIIMSPHYKMLGFEPGTTISRIEITSMPVIQMQSDDANNILRGTLQVKVVAPEVVSPQPTRLSTGHTTKLNLGEGEGYKYEYNE